MRVPCLHPSTSAGTGLRAERHETAGLSTLLRLVGHGSSVSAATWSPAGDVLCTGGVDQVVIAWRVRPADALARICRSLTTDVPGQAADTRCQRDPAA